MPWWIHVYLAVIILLTVSGYLDDWQRPTRWVEIFGGTSSSLASILFVVAFFNPQVSDLLGLWVFVILPFVFIYDFRDMQRALSEQDTYFEHKSETWNMIYEKGLVALGGILVLPAYVFGLLVGLRYTGV